MMDIGMGTMNYTILHTFLQNIVSIYIGSKIKMNTGDIGEIVFTPPEKLYMPIVKINDDYIDLSKSKKYKIEKLI